MAQTITFKGSPLTLVGPLVAVNAGAPPFTVAAQDLTEVRLGAFQGKIKVITTFPSLDTPVCDLQLKEFNKRAGSLSSGVVVIGISKDLPFAQKRFCDEFEINRVTVLSDYKTSSFGINYGLLIRELNLLARSVIIIDANDTVRYVSVVSELTQAPDYEAALAALGEVIKNPTTAAADSPASRCLPCEQGTPPLAKERIEKALAKHRGWELIDDKKIVKEFKFNSFTDAKYFLDTIAVLAQEQGHHPTLTLAYSKLKVTLTTHAAGGLTDNDFIMARLIDEAGGSR
jgi:thiol peroxidase